MDFLGDKGCTGTRWRQAKGPKAASGQSAWKTLTAMNQLTSATGLNRIAGAVVDPAARLFGRWCDSNQRH